MQNLEPPEGGKLWVFLAAGSYAFFNYRHQADVCHAYHVIRNHGVPEENIITMLFDDVVHSVLNVEYDGMLFNRNGGPDVSSDTLNLCLFAVLFCSLSSGKLLKILKYNKSCELVIHQTHVALSRVFVLFLERLLDGHRV